MKIQFNDNSSTRLDKFLIQVLKDFSRTFIQKIIKDGNLFVNGKIINKPSHTLIQHDLIEINIPEPKKTNLTPIDLDLDVIYEDKNYMIINKPSGLIVHPGAGTHGKATLVHGIMYIAKELSGIGGELRPGIVHRLDKDTSGLLIVCKNDLAHRFYSEKFKNREIKKTYVAIVYGKPQNQKGTYITNIGRSRTMRVKMASDGLNSKEAITHFEVIKEVKYFSYLELKLETGRTHQIRVHLSENGTPILGDDTYHNKNISNKITHYAAKENKLYETIIAAAKRLMLHSHILEFTDQTGKKVTYKAPLPKEFKTILSIFKKI